MGNCLAGVIPMFFVVSVPNEVFHKIMCLRALQRQLGSKTSISRDAPDLLRKVRGLFGGRLVLLDWSRARVLADIGIPGASGFTVNDQLLLACSWIDHSIYVLRRGQISHRLTHPWFNHLHSIQLTNQQTCLVASAGSDLIAEITLDGRLVWEWFGAEHGFGRLPRGMAAFFDRAADYRSMRVGTDEQAMHVTSVIHYSSDMVLATLFHQGQVIAINKATGETSVKLDGMTRPHGLHPRTGGFLASDTLGHRIVLLDDDFLFHSEIRFGSQWLQDTITTSEGTYLVLENVHIDQMPQKGLTNRIAEIDQRGVVMRSMELSPDYRLFTACEVDDACAEMLAASWGITGDFRNWCWSDACA
jgi:hypothetical protein